MKKPLILVTNDDGISAPGLRNLIQVMNSIGNVVVVVTEVGLAFPERVRVVPVVVNESPKSSPLGHTITALE